jgi:hypothetical protein
MMPGMSLTTTVYRRDSSVGSETITVMASLDDDGAEIRVIHERDDKVIDDTIPHYGEDQAAGKRWLEEHGETWTADGYRIVKEPEVPGP